MIAALVTAGAGCDSDRPTPPTGGTGTAAPTVRAPATPGSASISSPGFRAALIRELAKYKQIRPKFDAPWADCVIKALRSEGFRTVGDARAHPAKLRADGTICARHVILGLR